MRRAQGWSAGGGQLDDRIREPVGHRQRDRGFRDDGVDVNADSLAERVTQSFALTIAIGITLAVADRVAYDRADAGTHRPAHHPCNAAADRGTHGGADADPERNCLAFAVTVTDRVTLAGPEPHTLRADRATEPRESTGRAEHHDRRLRQGDRPVHRRAGGERLRHAGAAGSDLLGAHRRERQLRDRWRRDGLAEPEHSVAALLRDAGVSGAAHGSLHDARRHHPKGLGAPPLELGRASRG